MKAMIFAAGLGTRLKPLTDTIPKALVPVGGRPLIEIVIDRLKTAGFDDIVINVHHFADMIEEYVRSRHDFGIRIRFSDERDALLDTGGGILHAKSLLEGAGHFLVHNVDILSDVDLKSFAASAASDALATLLVSRRQTSRYLLFDGGMRMAGWTNVSTGEIRSPYAGDGKAYVEGGNAIVGTDVRHDIFLLPGMPAVSGYAFSGIHLISDRIFPLLEQYAESLSGGLWHSAILPVPGPLPFSGANVASMPQASGKGTPYKFSITDFYIDMCASQRIDGYVPGHLDLMDVGKISSLDEAEEFIRAHQCLATDMPG